MWHFQSDSNPIDRPQGILRPGESTERVDGYPSAISRVFTGRVRVGKVDGTRLPLAPPGTLILRRAIPLTSDSNYDAYIYCGGQRHKELIVRAILIAAAILVGMWAVVSVITSNGTAAFVVLQRPLQRAANHRHRKRRKSDHMTDVMGREMSATYVYSTNPEQSGFPYSGPQNGMLVIRKKEGRTLVMLRIKRGQFVCGFDTCSVQVRFDDGPIQRFKGGGADDYETDVLFIYDPTVFLAGLKEANRGVTKPPYYQEGSQR